MKTSTAAQRTEPDKADAKSPAGLAKSKGTKSTKSTVNSLAKGFRVLEAFSYGRPKMTLSEVCDIAQMDSGTVFRILNTLVDLGYVEKNEETRQFRLTLKVTDLGFHAIGRSDIRDLVLPILRALVRTVGETASFGVLEGADILYLERVRAGVTRLGVDIRVGTTTPANCSAIGQALLAFLPPQELDIVLQKKSNPSGTPAVALSGDELDRALEQIRGDGYALKESYFTSSLRVLAVPVLDRDGYPVAAISVVAPTVRFSESEMRNLALEPVKSAATEISRALRASGSISSAL
ncbi:IclR family transcriptional regulator [Marinobacterium aestuariivivens]|uniref:IclR family transcriptional regulator n=1 Tax=Marinobacterium aestuariivivens TaxID=1698799 RepID=A0ABW2A119_9GAMM